MKYYIIAGEASGDLHGSNLIKALRQIDQQAQFRLWGGDLMEAEGSKLIRHYKGLAFMGLVEVIKNLRTITSALKQAKNDILEWKPDVLILIDYPGFNLRIAEFAHQKKIKTVYYISPQIWAWKSSRVHKIKKYVDRMITILPFEKAFYQKFQVEVDYVGHPLLDAFEAKNNLEIPNYDKPVVAILPGSRLQEVKKMLPVMSKMASKFPKFHFVIAATNSLDKEIYSPYLNPDNISLLVDKTYSLLANSYAAMVTSGTATLETALWQVPQIVCYKGNWLTYQIGRHLVKVDFISLVNLIMDKELVKELIQNDFTEKKLEEALHKILKEDRTRSEITKGYLELKEKLGSGGASKRTANIITEAIKARN